MHKKITKKIHNTALLLSTGTKLGVEEIFKTRQQFRVQIPKKESLSLKTKALNPFARCKVTSFIGEFAGVFFDDEAPVYENTLVARFKPLRLADIKAPSQAQKRLEQEVENGFMVDVPIEAILTNATTFVIEDEEYTLQRHWPD